MTKILSETPRFECLSETLLEALLIRLTDNIKDCSHLPAIVGIFIWFILVSYKIKTKPPRFYVLESAAIARQRRTQCVVVLKSGGQFPETLSAQELLPGWQMGGGVSLVLLCWWFICGFCLLYSMLLVCCRLSKGNTFYLLFLREILKSGLLRLTTWCDILSCSHDLHFLVFGHHRFDDLIDKEVDFIENCRKCLGQAETEKQNIENTHTITVEEKDCSCNCEQESGGWRDHLELILPRLCFCAVSQVQS